MPLFIIIMLLEYKEQQYKSEVIDNIMRWGMVIDVSKCVRCHGCIMACRIAHFLPMGISWPRLMEIETSQPKAVNIYPVRCNHCKNAPCVDVCPTGANQQRDDGIVWVDQNKCVGCRYCVIACPYQNRYFVAKDKGYFPDDGPTAFEQIGKQKFPHQVGTTEKCNFCMERIDEGMAKGLKPGIDRDATPACVNTCPARAMTFGDLDDPESSVSKLIKEKKTFPLHPEYGTEPSIYYINNTITRPDAQVDSAEHERECVCSEVK